MLLAACGVIAVGLWACGKVYEPEAKVRTFELRAGTQLIVVATNSLDFQNLQPDRQFAATLAEPLTDGGTIIAPIGSPVAGRMIEGSESDSSVGIRLTSITILGGDEAPISTAPVFPAVSDGESGEPEVTADQRLAFVLDQPATLSWAMDPSVDTGEL